MRSYVDGFDQRVTTRADEVSGTLAFQHILELDGYEHDRLEEEYKTTLREAAYVEKVARRIGLEDVHIERFKGAPWGQWHFTGAA